MFVFNRIYPAGYSMGIFTLLIKNIPLHAFFISNTFISNTRLKLAKNQAKAKLNFCYLKIMHFVHSRYHSKIKGDNPKNVQKQVSLFQ